MGDCLVLASESRVLLDWMQDVIFCIPDTSTGPGRKIVVTTVALRGPKKPSELYLYYAERINGPVVDLTTTLSDKDHWLNVLSRKLGHIQELTGDGRIRLPRRPELSKDAELFMPTPFGDTPTVFPHEDNDVRQLIEESGHQIAPFTKVVLHARAWKNVAMRFGFTMPNREGQGTIRETPFVFLGPKQIADSIDQEMDEYEERVRQHSPSSFTQEKQDTLVKSLWDEKDNLQFHGNNGLYHLLVCAKPPHTMHTIVAANVTEQATDAFPFRWVRKDKAPSNPEDFLLSDPVAENEVIVRHFETVEDTFNIGCVVVVRRR